MIEHEALLRAELAQEENGVVLSGRLVDVLVSHLAKGAKAETKVPSGPEEVIAAAQAAWRVGAAVECTRALNFLQSAESVAQGRADGLEDPPVGAALLRRAARLDWCTLR